MARKHLKIGLTTEYRNGGDSMKQKRLEEKVREKGEEIRDQLPDGVEGFGERLQEEARGVGTRVKEGIRTAIHNSRDGERRPGRPPSGRPPSGWPPSVKRH